jgi:N-hydroxyarylamine O-acetyltransferase
VFDLAAYLHRIEVAGSREPVLRVLRDLHAGHVASIPFENLDPLMRRPVRLDAASLQEKLVRGGRGGYCFEQNLLFKHALEALGFEVMGLAARVVWSRPVETVTPRDHMLLAVTIDGEVYLADAGFGGQTLTGPIRLETSTPQQTPHERYRLSTFGREFVLESEIRGEWKALYRFDLQEQHLPDYEVANWYTSTCADSGFLSRLSVALAPPGKRHTLRNSELAVHETGEKTRRRTLASITEMRRALEKTFGLRLPGGPELDAALERVL